MDIDADVGHGIEDRCHAVLLSQGDTSPVKRKRGRPRKSKKTKGNHKDYQFPWQSVDARG